MERTWNDRMEEHMQALLDRYPRLECIRREIEEAYLALEDCYRQGGTLLAAGNGGSAADADHIVGELMKSFRLLRPVSEDCAGRLRAVDAVRGAALAETLQRALPAISLASHGALMTAYINDTDPESVYAQLLYGYGKPGDVFLGISTSGNSSNVLNAAVTARAAGLKVIGLTGSGGGELAKMADVAVRVPETETYRIQELHLPVYHCWCMMLEERFFGNMEDRGAL